MMNVREVARDHHRVGVTRRKGEWDAAQAELVGYGKRGRAAQIDVDAGDARPRVPLDAREHLTRRQPNVLHGDAVGALEALHDGTAQARKPSPGDDHRAAAFQAGGQLDPEAETVIITSGDGLKTLDAVTAVVDVPAPIRPTLEAFQEAVS